MFSSSMESSNVPRGMSSREYFSHFWFVMFGMRDQSGKREEVQCEVVRIADCRRARDR